MEIKFFIFTYRICKTVCLFHAVYYRPSVSFNLRLHIFSMYWIYGSINIMVFNRKFFPSLLCLNNKNKEQTLYHLNKSEKGCIKITSYYFESNWFNKCSIKTAIHRFEYLLVSKYCLRILSFNLCKYLMF